MYHHRFDPPLQPARLIRRYKRFLSDMVLPDGTEAVAHCGNPGSMMGLATPDSDVFLSQNTNPKAKLGWRWELASHRIGSDSVLVGINTNLANRIVEAALMSGDIEPLSGYARCRREQRYGTRNSRIDFLLDGGPDRAPCYVEVKSVTLRRPDGPDPMAAQFPDAKTERGAKHLAELTDIAATGARAVMLYLVQREDCSHFSLARDIDPEYAKAFEEARKGGVEMLCYDCALSPNGIGLRSPLPITLQD